MNKIKHGGPAFPSGESYSSNGVISQKDSLHQGMTMRDYFAAKATQGLLSGAYRNKSASFYFRDIAQEAHLLADAMLAQRGK